MGNTKHIQLGAGSTNASETSPTTESLSPNEVYYDLIYKKLKGGDIGLSFSVKQKTTAISGSPSARLMSLDWRQQTSLPWCEYAIIDMINEPNFPFPFAQTYEVLSQKRNWAWHGAGINYLRADGGSYRADTDDKKFYRFGGYNNVVSKFTVTWYDIESGNNVSN